MVNVLNKSNILNTHGHQETNRQLARENAELRHALEIFSQRLEQANEETHRKNLENAELKIQNEDLLAYKLKYERIRGIILDDNILCEQEVRAIQQAPSLQDHQNFTLSLPQPSGIDKSSFINSADSSSSDKEEQEEEQEEQQQPQEEEEEECISSPENPLNTISERSEPSSWKTPNESYSDSLDPSDASSVPPFYEKTVHTPSVWNCLDTLRSPSTVKSELRAFNLTVENRDANGSAFLSDDTSLRQFCPNTPNRRHDVISSTPVQKCPLDNDSPKNLVGSKRSFSQIVDQQPELPKQPKAKGRKRAVGTDENENEIPPAPRYNLRKRAK